MLDANFTTAKQIKLTQGFIDQMLTKLDIPTPAYNQDDLISAYSLTDNSAGYDTWLADLITALNTKKTDLQTEFDAL